VHHATQYQTIPASAANDRPLPDPETLIQQYLPLVRQIVKQLTRNYPALLDRQDLVSCGVAGLFEASRRFDAQKGLAFQTFARYRIRGSILDHIRVWDTVSRGTRQKARAIANTTRQLEGELGRAPTEEELLARLDLPPRDYRKVCLTLATPTFHESENISASSTDYDWTAFDAQDDPLARVLSQERTVLVAEALQRLPARERRALRLYYYQDLTMKEVGAALGVGESRVSQLHARALRRLKADLEQRFGDPRPPAPQPAPRLPPDVQAPADADDAPAVRPIWAAS